MEWDQLACYDLRRHVYIGRVLTMPVVLDGVSEFEGDLVMLTTFL